MFICSFVLFILTKGRYPACFGSAGLLLNLRDWCLDEGWLVFCRSWNKLCKKNMLMTMKLWQHEKRKGIIIRAVQVTVFFSFFAYDLKNQKSHFGSTWNWIFSEVLAKWKVKKFVSRCFGIFNCFSFLKNKCKATPL